MKHKMGIFYNEPNEEYHSNNGFTSSSQFKDMLNDPQVYHRKYILGDNKQEQKDCFILGNAYHSKILEPHLFDKEYVRYDGHKRGDKWKVSKAKHEGKIILGNMQWNQFENLVASTLKHPNFKELDTGGKSEVSVYVMLHGFPVKVRFDKVNMLKGFGYDLKSTTGQLFGKKGLQKCRQSIAGLDYDLSAALYLDALNELLRLIAEKKGTEFKPVSDWYWIFASKDYSECKICKASLSMLRNGRNKYKLAMKMIREHESSNWESTALKETIETIDPIEYDIIQDESQGEKAW